ncbi:amino acid adenylation domain-containing protein, partial [Neisseriaceae bacterium TC5R-5]|nr:amino acid adenylation domain-containing protein [Neisseriaceae bacterium TC5R-5]
MSDSAISAVFPASAAQYSRWFQYQIEPDKQGHHNIPFCARVKGLTPERLTVALNKLVLRHPMLRTSFVWDEGQLGYRIHEQAAAKVWVHDAQQLSADKLQEMVADDCWHRFDLNKPLRVYASWYQCTAQKAVMMLTFDHIAVDGWSYWLLLDELRALLSFEELEPVSTNSFQDYVQWQQQWLQSPAAETQRQYWQTTLAGELPVLSWPSKRRRTDSVKRCASLKRLLPQQLLAKLQAMAAGYGNSLFPIFLAAYQVLLQRHTGLEDIIIGSIMPGRGRGHWGKLVGEFVNPVTLRGQVHSQTTVHEQIQQAQQLIRQGIAKQQYPFSKVLEQLKLARYAESHPVFQSNIIFHKARYADDALLPLWLEQASGSTVQWGAIELSTFPYSVYADTTMPLVVDMLEVGEQVRCGFYYDSDIFDAETIAQWMEQLFTLLASMSEDEQQTLDQLSLLNERERQQVLYDFNATAAPYPQHALIHQLFEQQAARAPAAIALRFGEAELSYGELNRRANQLAHRLIALGIRPDDRVAICVERSLEMVVGLLAILKAGGAYVPLDPSYPVERLAYMLMDSEPVALLTQTDLLGQLPEVAVPTLLLDEAAAWMTEASDNPDAVALGLNAKHLAYVIYTSGSTGLPKGVMVEHHSITGLLIATENYFHFDSNDVWTFFHSFAFDFAVWELWGALAYGGRLILVPSWCARSPHDFYTLLCQEGVTILNQTPSAFRSLLQATEIEKSLSHQLRCVIFGGEALEPYLLGPWVNNHGLNKTRLVNMYGITEITVHATYRELQAEDILASQASLVGKALPNLSAYILDSHQQPVPIGVTGELYIGGTQIARGYLNLPELTAERFIADPFSQQAGARMYKTGDLGRWLADGNIEYLGRNDFQVKIRGFRIELGEIEVKLAQCEGVREAVVMAREDVAGDKRLVAYLVLNEGVTLEPADLRSHLSTQLAEHMLPSAFMTLNALPLTPNGKLDRKALPAPDGSALVTREYEAPQGELEVQLAEIWQDLLGVERVGRHDNFFELGGHSLLIVSLIERLRVKGLSLAVSTVFATPTLVGVASKLSGEPAPTAPVPANLIPMDCQQITPAMLPLVTLSQSEIDQIAAKVTGGMANIQDIYPLAPLQEGILFHHLLGGEGDPYLLHVMMAFDSRERVEGFLQALQQVIDRHDILRSAMQWQGLARPVQVVHRCAPLPVRELTLSLEGDALQQLRELTDPRCTRLDITQAPLLAVSLAEDPASGEWLLALLQHHLVSDHLALEIMLNEIQAFLAGEGASLPSSLPYRNFIAQVRSVPLAVHEAYFREQLSDIEEPTAPFGLLDVQGDGTEVSEASLTLDRPLAEAVREVARQQGVSVAVLFHVVWAQVLAQCSNRDDVVFGTVLLGRSQGVAGADQVLGLFINTLPLRVQLGARSVRQVVQDTYQRLSTLLTHEQAPLALAQRCSGVAAPLPLFNSLLNYRHSQGDEASQSWEGMRLVSAEERTNYPLCLSVDDLGMGLALTAQSSGGVAPERLIAYAETALCKLVIALRNNPEQAIQQLSILSTREREQVLVDFNATTAPYPQHALIHQLFEQQVARAPAAIALRYGNEELSYGELNRRANQLAHRLIALGIRPDDRVAICVERSLEMVVGLLGILKAGGAYVPLDPS